MITQLQSFLPFFNHVFTIINNCLLINIFDRRSTSVVFGNTENRFSFYSYLKNLHFSNKLFLIYIVISIYDSFLYLFHLFQSFNNYNFVFNFVAGMYLILLLLDINSVVFISM